MGAMLTFHSLISQSSPAEILCSFKEPMLFQCGQE